MLKPPGIYKMFGCFLLGQCHVGLTVCRCREDKPPAQTGPSQARERDGVTELPPDYTCDTARRPAPARPPARGILNFTATLPVNLSF